MTVNQYFTTFGESPRMIHDSGLQQLLSIKGKHVIYLIKIGFGVWGIDFIRMWHVLLCEQAYYASA